MGLVLRSWVLLVYFDFVMKRGGFEKVHAVLKRKAVQVERSEEFSIAALSHAMDMACVLYFKRVLCLQRSAATTVLLRSYGWQAEMVIGAKLLPFLSHAWVEVDSCIVNDKPYMAEMFRVMERC